MKRFEQQLKALPLKPGVYLFRDKNGEVLYVGKARSLRSRVSSYFQSSVKQPLKTRKMVSLVADFDFIVTDSEQEAIFLECTLIKKYRPHFNVALKDDKTFPYLKISINDDWPRIYTTRRFEKDGSWYFGPFADMGSVRMTMNMLKKLFPYRSCKKKITATETRPCLNYHIHRCVGPCTGTVSREEYGNIIRQVILFLQGKQQRIISDLQKKMEDASANLDFEKAAVFRDQIQAVERVVERQKVVSSSSVDEDVIAFAQDGNEACVLNFIIRGGKLIGREHFILEGTGGESAGQIIASYIKLYYVSSPAVPPKILIQYEADDIVSIKQWLEHIRGSKVSITTPVRGEKKKLVSMVAENANQLLAQCRIRKLADSSTTLSALTELKEKLHLPAVPKRIECYDISDIHGSAAVGSMIVFSEGLPTPSDYRRFKVKLVTRIDDYAMMKEILRRRFARSDGFHATADKQTSWSMPPDLIVIDGGKGHLSAAMEVVREFNLDSLCVISIAKADEHIFIPGANEPVILKYNSQARYLLQRIRDEAHRFALAYHRQIRQKRMYQSALDTIPGIGTKRKKILLQKYGSVKKIRESSVEELALLPHITKSLASTIKKYL